MAFRKKDETKKKIQEELAKKYPMQNPRTNVVAVVTKKEVPQWAAKSSGQTRTAAINRDVNAHTKVEKLPLHVNKPTKVNTILQRNDDKFYVTQSADGWKRYQTDESNRLVLERDKSYQKWRSQGGRAEPLDQQYKPGKDWSVTENNTFGYLYGQDKQKAYNYAKNLNDLLSRHVDDMKSSLREGAQGQAEKLKDFGENVWNIHTAAQQANSTAHEMQAERVRQIGRTALKTNTDVLNAQAEQSRQQVDLAGENGRRAWKWMQSNMGAINDATLSNQIGAGAYGFLKSASIDEQNEIENVDRQKEMLVESVTDNVPSMIGGFIGARAANVLQPLDLLRSGWEEGAFGHVDLNGGEFYQIKDTIDGAISDKLGESLPRISEDVPYIGGMGADDIYDIITSGVDDSILLKAKGGIVFKGIGAASESFHSLYEEAKRKGVDEKLAIKYATSKAFGAGVMDILGDVEFKKLNNFDVDEVFGKILSEGIKNGMFEVIKDADRRFVEKYAPWNDEKIISQNESAESAERWRNGFLGGVLQGSTKEVGEVLKSIMKNKIAQK